jgi:hypothetical protein
MPSLSRLHRGSLVTLEIDRLAICAWLQLGVRRDIGGIQLRELESLQQLSFVIQ